MSKPSVGLIQFLAHNPLPWLKYDEAKGKLVMVVDNHLMSTYRACPTHFVRAHIDGYKRKGVTSDVTRNWFLDFGICLHKMLEVYYQNFQTADFDIVSFATQRGFAEWSEMKMDAHCEHKEYKLIGGLPGFTALLIQYATIMSAQNEHLRILGTEVSFGRNLEVPLLIRDDLEVYLAGRMDLIVDDGYFICPMDHKTMGTFRGDPGLRFETDEGPTGYIYALASVLPQMLTEEQILKRDCSKILMNLISKAPTSVPQDRFKRIPIRKTAWQLEQYHHRMITTAEEMVRSVESVASFFPIHRNTQVCQNWVHQTCTYFDVCRQQSKEAEAMTLQNGFIKAALWNTEEVKPTT
jgi:hypothetical protein